MNVIMRMRDHLITIKRALTPPASRAAAAALRAAKGVGHRIQAIWAAHDQSMQGNDLYRALVIAISAALARQIDLRRLVLAIIAALMAAWAHARGQLSRPPRFPYPYDDDGDPGWAYA